jgi:hypothetical protein
VGDLGVLVCVFHEAHTAFDSATGGLLTRVRPGPVGLRRLCDLAPDHPTLQYAHTGTHRDIDTG